MRIKNKNFIYIKNKRAFIIIFLSLLIVFSPTKAVVKPINHGERNFVDSGLHYIIGDDNSIINEKNYSEHIIYGEGNNINSSNHKLKENVIGNNVTGNTNRIGGTNNNSFGSLNHIHGDKNTAIGNLSDINANNSVSIGSLSYNDRDNTVSFGNKSTKRQLTNIGAGTEDHDAINLKQLREAVSGKIDVIGITKEINNNIDIAKNKSTNISKNYTNKKSGEAITSENRYTDNRLSKFTNYTKNRFDQLDNQINSVKKTANAGIAGVTAIASIPYSNSEKFSLGMGVGNYHDGKAIAAGAQYKIADNTNVRVNISWNNDDKASVGAGFAISF